MLCNRAVFNPEDIDEPIANRRTIGDASESALIKFTEQLTDIEDFRKDYPKVAEIPFNSVNKWQLSIHEQTGEDKRHLLVIKGKYQKRNQKIFFLKKKDFLFNLLIL